MKAFSPELLAHYASGATTLARLVKITRLDGQVHAYTDHDEPITFASVLYATLSTFDASAISTRAAMNVASIDLTGIIEDDGITAADIDAGLWDGASVEVCEVNFRDLTMGCNILPGATLGVVQRNGLQYKVELRGLAFNLQNTVGRTVLPTCDATLGDARCGIVLSPAWERTCTVTDVTSQRVFVCTLAEAAGWATYGKVLFSSGENAGIAMEIKLHAAAGALTLQLDMPRTVAIGDVLTVTAGCDHVHSVAVDADGVSTGVVTGDCKNKFANVVNFRGFPSVPTQKKVTLFGGQE